MHSKATVRIREIALHSDKSPGLARGTFEFGKCTERRTRPLFQAGQSKIKSEITGGRGAASKEEKNRRATRAAASAGGQSNRDYAFRPSRPFSTLSGTGGRGGGRARIRVY